MKYIILFLIFTICVSTGTEPVFGSIKFEATDASITSVDRNGDMLVVSFNGAWSDGPLPIISKSRPNAVVFRLDAGTNDQKMNDLERRFRAVASKNISFSFSSPGWASRGGIPIVSLSNLEVTIKE
jgi:hypothetical protein